MSCILMHSDYDAFMCINVHKFVFQFTTAELPDFDATRADDSYVKMHTNAHMHKNAPECIQMRRTRGPHIHTQETPSGLKARLTWKHAAWTRWASDGL